MDEKKNSERSAQPQTDVPLTEQQLDDFNTKGWVHLEEAFPPQEALKIQDFMWEHLNELHSIERHAPDTWPPLWNGLNKQSRHPIYQAVASPRLNAAIGQILGKDQGQHPTGGGTFLVSPPDEEKAPWDVKSYQWHWDGAPENEIDTLQILNVYTFYSAVEPGGGGTLFIEGSHRLIRTLVQPLGPDRSGLSQKELKCRFVRSHPWLAELTGNAPDQGDRIRRFMQEGAVIDGVPVRVIEATGKPGDAMLLHPSLYHTPSYNRTDSPRFMRNCGVKRIS